MALVPEIIELAEPLIGPVLEGGEAVEEVGSWVFEGAEGSGGPIEVFENDPGRAREVADYYRGRTRGFGVREIARHGRNVDRAVKLSGLSGPVYAVHWLWDKITGKRPHQEVSTDTFEAYRHKRFKEMADAQMVLADSAPAIPRIYRNSRRKRIRKSRFERRVSAIVERQQERFVPLSLFCASGSIDPAQNISSGTQAPYWSVINIADAGGGNGGNSFSNIDIIYDGSCFGKPFFGTATPTPYTFPYSYVRGFGGLTRYAAGLSADWQTRHSIFDFLGTDKLNQLVNDSWVELKYEQCSTCICIPSGLTGVKMCIYYLLIPAEYATSPNNRQQLGTQFVSSISSVDVKLVLEQCFGNTWMQRNLPSRFNSQKKNIKMMKKMFISYDNSKQANQALVGATASNFAENVPQTFIVNTMQKRYFKSWKFRYGSNGMRFYVTNQASDWLSWASPGTFYFFLGNDRMTPYIPVRFCKYYVIPSNPSFTGMNRIGGEETGFSPTAGTGYEWCDVFTCCQTFTWFRYENPGNFV